MSNGAFWLFCCPGNIYRRMDELSVAQAYTQMAISDYDMFVTFEDSYLPFAERSDHEEVVSKKEERNLGLTLFFDQEVKSFGEVSGKFKSSSYLFNPGTNNLEITRRGLLLPDMDVVQVSGEGLARAAVEEVEKFYRGYGWATKILEGNFRASREVETKTVERDFGRIKIVDPVTLIGVGRKFLDYDFEKLCFGDRGG